ncbi:MAG: hypothetical protein AB7K68_10010 [Bacteriovoracia bacterium]
MPQSNPNIREPHPENKGERNPVRSLPLKKGAVKDFKKSSATPKNKNIHQNTTVTDGEDG